MLTVLQVPYFYVAVDNLGSDRRKPSAIQTHYTVTVAIIMNGINLLLIHVQIKCVTFSYNSNHIDLIESDGDSGRYLVYQSSGPGGIAMVHGEIVVAIL